MGTHPDVRVVLPEGERDVGVDTIREVLEETLSYPSVGPLRFFLIDGADRLTTAAANAILKTLEDPPRTTRFILLAENYKGVIPTIRSRCGRVSFSRLPEDVITTMVQRHEPDATKALVYARVADGSIGRAIRYWGSGRLHLRDQVISLLELGLSGELSSLFSRIDTIGQGLPLALRLLAQILHDLLIMPHDQNRMINLDAADRLAHISRKMGGAHLTKMVSGVRSIQARANAASINVAYNLKNLFVSTFFI